MLLLLLPLLLRGAEVESGPEQLCVVVVVVVVVVNNSVSPRQERGRAAHDGIDDRVKAAEARNTQ